MLDHAYYIYLENMKFRLDIFIVILKFHWNEPRGKSLKYLAKFPMIKMLPYNNIGDISVLNNLN